MKRKELWMEIGAAVNCRVFGKGVITRMESKFINNVEYVCSIYVLMEGETTAWRIYPGDVSEVGN